jgi:hypothetical protein
MEFDLSSGEICLRDNHPIRLQQARGLRITCTAGTIWLTVNGVPGDIILQPGESHQLTGNGLALIESLGSGRIRLHKPERFRHLSRVTAAIRRLIGHREKAGTTASGRLSRIG